MVTRKCCYCWDVKLEKEMTRVPRKDEQRAIWVEKLGDRFAKRIQGKSTMFICRSHFANLSESSRRTHFKTPVATTVEVRDKQAIDQLMNEMVNIVVWKEIGESDVISLEDEKCYEYEEEFVPDIDIDEETENDLKPAYDYILVDYSILLETLLFCQNCTSKNVIFEPRNCVGAAFSATFTCFECHKSWSWSSTRRNGYGRQVNTDITVASTVCGLSLSKMQQFFECLRVPHLTERAHYNIVKSKVAPAIQEAYNKMQSNVLDVVVARGENTGSINVAGDAMFDSPGFSAIFCRYAILCVDTHFVLDVETLRKERNDSSKAMEPRALEVALTRLDKRVRDTGKAVEIGSITTDRDSSVKKMLSEKFGSIKTWSDIWHFVKNLQKLLRKKQDQVQMYPVQHWIRPLCNHLYHSIASSSGDGELAVEKFMTFFLHIQGIHTRFRNVGEFCFTRFKKCDHGKLKKNPGKYLDLTIDSHKRAFDILFELTATPKRLSDMLTVSPHFATSEVEAFNSLSILYHPKSRFFSTDGFRMRTQLSVLHWNSLKLEKLEGTRVVERQKSHYSKTHKTVIWKDVFTKGTNKWRQEIYDNVRKGELTTTSNSTVFYDIDDDDNEEVLLELEEFALDDFGFEFEAFDTDEEEYDSEPEFEIEETSVVKPVWKDEGSLEIDFDEKRELIKNWESLVVDKKERLLSFPLKTPVSTLTSPYFRFENRANSDILKMFKPVPYSKDFKGVDVSSSDED